MLTPTGNPCEVTPAPGGAPNGTYPTSPAPTATRSFTRPGNGSYPTSIVTAAAARPTGVWLGAAAWVVSSVPRPCFERLRSATVI
ncbi:hypothetical protein NUW58_g5939 [Xylaria curta]|uniref:Uncharacterized protein n=1 Tax=Xylaria curta TaxID=42375 RepID=A0ACC1NZX9_9PEZI|nr:hypothetical protein NUW58_g5939 [Xylaria curta]